MPRKRKTPLPEAYYAGRPREYNRDQLALDLISWAKLPDSLNLNGFAAKKELNPEMLIDWVREEPLTKFGQAYKIAKAILAQKREQALNSGRLHQRAYERNAIAYDLFLKHEEREQKEYEAKLEKEKIELRAKLEKVAENDGEKEYVFYVNH